MLLGGQLVQRAVELIIKHVNEEMGEADGPMVDFHRQLTLVEQLF